MEGLGKEKTEEGDVATERDRFSVCGTGRRRRKKGEEVRERDKLSVCGRRKEEKGEVREKG